MTRTLFALAAATLAAGCDVTTLLTEDSTRDPALICPTGSPTDCAFVNAPVRIDDVPTRIPGRAYTFFPMATELTFVDGARRQWQAPAGTLTDGASIPPIFVPIVGDPTDPPVRGAAAIHDAYCGIGNESGPNFHAADWPDVHRMFYDALVAGGTSDLRAKVMFAAVYLAGPRWTVHRPDTDPARDLSTVPAPRLQEAMRSARSFIETTEPDLPTLERYLIWLERQMIREQARARSDDDRPGSSESGESEGFSEGSGLEQ
ncbi:DUF1353 domain-containing protein [Roseivivax isoporae]|uniref:DUF1353 domain-containing protein n=1 Tax=Roseivivax isoporae LMG 25204 TaxID=1449351 RepID=X7F2M5_9RHOB|nr:DUF1353 domain-containing protein [Roseivivax isoporae]ETX27162.1 hypothetical protein RISW2_15350 [Roseivivax isoporae LMG 25204]